MTLIWEDGKAKAILVPVSAMKHYPFHPDSASFFKIKVDGQDAHIIGSAQITERGLMFVPLWPFSRGVTYKVYWKENYVDSIRIPPGTGADPSVQVYPGGDTLPENLLKIYLTFTKPMTEGSSTRYLKLLDADGDTLQNIFLDLKPELWNNERTMLTVWIDPGRIKRDLLLNRELGKPLESGRLYSLIILPGWNDTEGMPLKRAIVKKFFSGPADRKKPDIGSWSLQVPHVHSNEPLVIFFPEPMDYSLAIRGIDIYSEYGILKGRQNLADHERKWEFFPEKKWVRGKFRIVVAREVEDLAGNNLDRLFDSDLNETSSALEKPESNKFTIDFEIH
jgi:hypothetical protein